MRCTLVALLALAAACGARKDGKDAKQPPPRDAAGAIGPAAPADAAGPASLDDAEPTVPPPAPTVVEGGKGDCRTDHAPRPTRDPNPMCKIDGGTFMMGADDDDPDARDNERPARQVTVSPFFLDQFEVTVGQVVHFLNTVGDNDCGGEPHDVCFGLAPTRRTWQDPYYSPILFENGTYLARPGSEREPIDSATTGGAERYCGWVGKRLPSEAEWELAARHDPRTRRDLRYPWGDAVEPRRANCNEDVCRDGFDRLAPVGSFEAGASPWGVHDLAGNAAEIVRDCYGGPYEPCSGPCKDPIAEGARTCRRAYRSSSWSSHAFDLRVTMRQQEPGGPGNGFRCAR